MKERGLPKNREIISATRLLDLYFTKKHSVSHISDLFGCSENKINYWLKKYEIPKRTISDAIYQLKNPLGDPFLIKKPSTLKEGILFGIGLGLYWGEGDKRGKNGVRLSNTDPNLLRKFTEFLETFFKIDKKKLKFSIQIFEDLSARKTLDYWSNELNVDKEQFYKPTIVKVRGKGTYKYRSEHGVVILQFNNIKLKKIICGMIENIH